MKQNSVNATSNSKLLLITQNKHYIHNQHGRFMVIVGIDVHIVKFNMKIFKNQVNYRGTMRG